MLPQGYKDPAKETLMSGRTIADVVGLRGPRGLKGAIVSSAGIDGRPLNFDPHNKSQIKIVIDPDNPHSQSLTLSQFTKGATAQAFESAVNQVHGNDIESIRERTAVAFEELAKIANSGVQASKPPHMANKPSGTAHAFATAAATTIAADLNQAAPAAPETEYTPPEMIDRSYSPMAAFGLKKATTNAHRVPSSSKGSSAGPPNKLLYFEKEGIGTVPAFFHDVVIDVNQDDDDALSESGFIVLIYDLRFEQAAARWFPPANDPYRRPWAVQVNNDRRLYLVHTTGFQYVYDEREFCVLMVEKAVIGE